MALTGSAQDSTPSPIIMRNVSLRIPMRRKGAKRLKTNPLSLLASFYAVGGSQTDVRSIIKDVSLEVGDGDRLALIGRNGAGKTTLLRLLAGSVAPTRGSIEMRGSVQALLNVSLGFSPQATGIENIYLRGLSMGMSLAEIGDSIPDIAAFSELGDAIYDPIKTYSAGMRAKLAFSVATSRSPNILLMDEWISAGDKYFVEKAQERLRTQIETCRALVLASHNNNIIKEICTHGLVLENGRVSFFGKVDDALLFYEESGPLHNLAAEPNDGETKLTKETKETLSIDTSQGQLLVKLASNLPRQRVARIKRLVQQGAFEGSQMRRSVVDLIAPSSNESRDKSRKLTDDALLICLGDGTLLDCKYRVLGHVIDGPDTSQREGRAEPESRSHSFSSGLEDL